MGLALRAPSFDAEEYAAAFVPPTITIGGTTHVGRLLSADEWFAIAPRIEAITKDASREAMAELIRDLTDRCFPRAWWRWWQPRVSTLLTRLPWGAQLEAIGSFTVAQALAQTGRAPGRPTMTPPSHSTAATNGMHSVA